MDYVSTVVYQSEMAPEVKATIKLLSVRDARELAQDLARACHTQTETVREFMAVSAATLSDAPGAFDALVRIETLADVAVVNAALEAERIILRYVVSISGLTINGRPATPSMLLSDGPPELVRELITAITSQAPPADQSIPGHLIN